jgi:hypothetical protein
MIRMITDSLKECIGKALSKENRKPFDGDSNAPYRLIIEMAEVGPDGREEGGFFCAAKIPRQVDNCLGMSLIEGTNDRKEAIEFLEMLIEKLREK